MTTEQKIRLIEAAYHHTCKNLRLIEAAYHHACKKHPFFAQEPLVKTSPGYASACLTYVRNELKQSIEDGTVTGYDVLMCEIEEAGYEYAKGDHKACVEELAQCAAVIMRMIDMVQAEAQTAARL